MMMMEKKNTNKPPDILSEKNKGKSCDVLSIYTGKIVSWQVPVVLF